MTFTARLSQAAALVKAFEPFHARAVASGEGWALGYGHTASAREGASVSPAEADALLLYDLDQAAKIVDGSVYAPLNDNQRQALVAFGFNVGPENLRRSTALRRLNAGDYLGAAREIERWRRAELAGEGQVVDALVRRRAAEKALFLTPPEGFPKAPTPVLRPLFDAEPDADFSASSAGTAAEPPSAAMAAAQGVSDRLRALVPEPEPAPETPDQTAPAEAIADGPFEAVDVETSVQPAPDLMPPPVADPDPVEAPPVEDAPPPPPPFVRHPGAAFAPPRPANEALPPIVVPPVAPRADDRAELADAALGQAAPAIGAQSLPPTEAGASAPMILQAWRIAAALLRRGPLVIGGLGALLFLLAVASIVGGRPTAANLAIGLAGVLCLVPAVFAALGRGEPKTP